MNTVRIKEGHSDYLAMCSPPDFENLSSPHNYVNEFPLSVSAGDPQPSGYLFMKPGSIFSPREVTEGDVFTFDDKTLKDSAKNTNPELLPMLNMNSDNECDSPNVGSPTLPNSFSNPSYQLAPVISGNGGDILQSNDNYVNMPKNKSAIKNDKKDATKEENNYVNSASRDWEKVNA